MELVPIFGILGVFVAAPSIVLGFIFLMRRSKNQVEMMRYRKEALELEVRKEELRVQSLREENRRLDRLISDGVSSLEGPQGGRR